MTDSQLIFWDFKEHTTGNLILALDENVQLDDILVPLRGQFSISVMLPSNLKLKFSKRASADGEDVALTEL